MKIEKYIDQYHEVEALFSKDNILSTLEKVANTLAPSQSVSITRAAAVRELINGYDLPGAVFDPDYLNTGNSLFSSNTTTPSILFLAHLDQISYLVDEKISEAEWRLVPYCKHLSQIEVPAKALRYNPAKNNYTEAAAGFIYSEGQGADLTPYFRAVEGQLESGDRVVYEYPIQVDGDFVKGNLDNAAGAVACLVAGAALFRVLPESQVGFIFTDEEEGPSDNPLSFARGARRLMNKISTPDVCVIIDGHGQRGQEDVGQIGKGTFFTEKTGNAHATVTPPALFMKIKSLADDIQPLGIGMFENYGRVSRSDDIPCLSVTPNVISIGYPSINGHHEFGPPMASLNDLENLAKVIFWVAIALGSHDV